MPKMYQCIVIATTGDE